MSDIVDDWSSGDEELEGESLLTGGSLNSAPVVRAKHSSQRGQISVTTLLIAVAMTAVLFFTLGRSTTTVKQPQQPAPDNSSPPSAVHHPTPSSTAWDGPRPPAPPPKHKTGKQTRDNPSPPPAQVPQSKDSSKSTVPTSMPTITAPSASTTTTRNPSTNPTIIPSSAPSTTPTASFSSYPTTPYHEEEDPTFVPHIPPFASADASDDPQNNNNNNKTNLRSLYRRICAPVHSSILCLTLRFPFEVTPQDPNRSYPYPVNDEFYNLDKVAHFVEEDDLQHCLNLTSTTTTTRTIEDVVQQCLDDAAVAQSKPTVVAVWTRRRWKETEFSLYGITLAPEQQGQRIDKFFDKHLILILGASPAPAVLACMYKLFGNCKYGGLKPTSQLCRGHDPVARNLGNTRNYTTLPMDMTYLGVQGYYPFDKDHGRHHLLNKENVVDKLRSMASFDLTEQPEKPKNLRKLTLLVEYPIAHAQNQNMLYEEWSTVQEIQNGFPQSILYAQSEEGRKELADMGYDMQYIIAFDGIPQFNPSKTGAYDWAQKRQGSEQSFLKNKGYPGWIPDYGSTCRGPLPPNSKLTATNRLSRRSFAEHGLDMRFYGRTWEFANQFWFHTRQWTSKKGLDCTHSNEKSGMSCVHRYFLMAMVDDHFDNLLEAENN